MAKRRSRRRKAVSSAIPSAIVFVLVSPAGSRGQDAPPPQPAPDAPAAALPPVESPAANTPPDDPTARARLRFNFKGAPWDAVIDFMAREAGLPVVRQAAPPGSTVDFISASEYTFDEAIDIVNRLLFMHGQQLQRKDGFLVLMTLPEAVALSPEFQGAIPGHIGDAQIVTVVLPLHNAAAAPTADQIQALLTPNLGKVTPLPAQNMLVVVDTASACRRIRDLVLLMDAEPPSDSQFKLFPLKYAKAEAVQVALTGLIAVRERQIIIDKDGKQRVVEEQNIAGLNLQADPRTNSIIAVGSQSRLAMVEELITLLDRPEGSEGDREMMTFSLGAISPAEAAKNLTALFTGVNEQSRPQVLPLDSQGKVTVVASPPLLLQAAALLHELDPGSAPTTGRGNPGGDGELVSNKTAVVSLHHVSPDAAISVATRLLSPRQQAVLRFASSPDGKGLIVTGPARDVDSFRELVGGLDAPPRIDREVRQVRIAAGDPEAVIARAKQLYGLSSRAQTDPVTATLDDESRTVTLVGGREGLAAFVELVQSAQANTHIDVETRTYELSRARPSVASAKLVRLARPLLEPADGSAYVAPQVDALDELGTLVVRAQPAQFAVLDKLVSSIDQPEPGGRTFRVVKLDLADAASVIDRAMQLYDVQTRGLTEEQAGPITADVDEASGSLLISGTPAGVNTFASLLDQVRLLTPPARTPRLIEARQVQASEIVGPLREMLSAADSIDPSRRMPEPTIQIIDRTNSLLVTAEEAQHRMIAEYVARLDRVESTELPPLKLLQLRAADAVSIAAMLTEQYGKRSPAERAAKPVDIQADASTNTLIVAAHTALFDEIRTFVDDLNKERDRPERVTELFPLKVARAEAVAAAMQMLYPEPPIPLDARGRPMPWARKSREVLVSADPASNSLIIEAPAERMAAFTALAEKLDRVELPPVAQLRTYRVTKADVRTVATMLQGLARSNTLSAPSEPGKPSVEVMIETEPASSTLIVAGDDVTFERVESLLKELEERTGVERGLRIVPISNAEASEVRDRAVAIYDAQVALLPDADSVDVSVDEATNSLEVVGDAEATSRFLQIIDELQRQAGPAREVRLIDVRFAKATDVVGFLNDLLESSRPFGSQGGPDPVFEAIEATNQLLVAAQPSQLPIVESLVRTLDARETSDKPPMRILRLRTTDAASLAQALDAAYEQRPPEQRTKFPVDIQADAATNTLIVSAHAEVFPEIEAIVSELNSTQAVDAEGREIRIFPLRVARAEELAQTIDQMYPEPPMPFDARGRPRPDLRQPREITVRADRATNSLIVDAPIQRMTGFEQLVQQLDQQQVPDNVELRTYRVRRADLAVVASTLRDLASAKALAPSVQSASAAVEGLISISAEPATRTLIVSGPSEIFVEVEKVLDRLDSAAERPATSLRMYTLEHARADRLQPLLDEILSARLREELDREGQVVEARSLLDVAAHPSTNTLIISAPESIQQIASELIRSLDAPSANVGRPVIRVVPLTYADAQQTAATLNEAIPAMELPSGGGVSVIATAGSNALLLSGLSADLAKVEELLASLDVRPVSEDATDVRTFALEHADPVVIASTVERLLQDQQQTDPRIIRMQMQFSRGQMPKVPQVRVEADERTNSLIVSGPAATLELAQTIIERLDQPAGDPGRTAAIFTPAKGDPQKLADAARPILNATLPAGRKPVELMPEAASGSIVVLGTPEQVAEASRTLADLDERSAAVPEVELRVFDIENTDAAVIAGSVQSMLADRTRWPDGLRRAEKAGLGVITPAVNADPGANRVLVSAPGSLMPIAESLIAALDRPRGQGDIEVRVFPLTRAEASGVAEALSAALAAGAKPGDAASVVSAERGSNSVIVAAPAGQMVKAAEIISSLDDTIKADGTVVRTVYLKHARAEAVAPLVQQLLEHDSGMPSNAPAWIQWEFIRMRGESGAQGVRVAAERRLNAIVITGPLTLAEVAEQIVAGLDADPAGGGPSDRHLRVITLDNADASEVSESVTALFEDDASGLPAPTVRIDRGSNSLIVRGAAEQLSSIEELVSRLDNATLINSREMRLIPVDRSRADAAMMAEALQRLLQQRGGSTVEIISIEDLLKDRSPAPPAPGKQGTDASWPGSPAELAPAPVGIPGVIARVASAYAIGAFQPEAPPPPATSVTTTTTTAPPSDNDAKVTIAVDPVTNSLIVLGSPRMAQRLAELAAQLEKQMPAEPGRVRIIELPDGVDARSAANIVWAIVQQLGPRSAENPGGLTGRTFVTADPAGDALIVSANDTDFGTLRELIIAVATPGGARSLTVKIYPLSNITAQRAAAAITDLVSGDPRGRQAQRVIELSLDGADGPVLIEPGAVRASADPTGSSIIVSAPGEVVGLIDRFVEMLDQSPLTGRLTIRRFTLENAKADEAARTLQSVFDASRQGPNARDLPQPRFVADARTNSLLVTAPDGQLAEAERLIASLDQKQGEETQVAIIPLQVARPTAVREFVEAALVGRDPARKDKVQVTARDDSNLLVIRASEADLAQARELIARLDQAEFDGTATVRAIKLQRADASEVARALQQFFRERERQAGARPGGGGVRGVAVVGDERSATLVVSATDEQMQQVQALIDVFDAPAVSRDLQFKIIPLEHARVADVRTSLQVMVDAVRGPMFFSWWGDGSDENDTLEIEFNDRTNSVILVGQGEGFETVEQMIQALDVPAAEQGKLGIRLVRLENADPQTIARVVQQAMATPGWRSWQGRDPDAVQAESNAGSRSVVLIGRADRVEEAIAYVSQLDAAAQAPDQGLEVVPVRFARADTLARTVTQFLGDRARAAGGRAPAATVVGSRESNVVVVSAPPDEMALVRDLLSQMDQPDEGEGRVRTIHQLKNAKAADIAATVREQFPAAPGGRENAVIVTPQANTNSLIISAPELVHSKVDALIAQLDAPPSAEDSRIITVTLESARADDVAMSLRAALPTSVNVKITPVRRTNSILLTGSDEAIALVMAEIEKIDAQRTINPVEVRKIPLKHALAFEVGLTLRNILRDLPLSDGEPRPAVSTLNSENALLVQATKDQFATIEQVVAQVDVPADQSRSTEFIPLRHADAEQTAQALNVFYGPTSSIPTTPEAERVVIIAVPVSNSLVVSADEKEWAGIRGLLEKLDSEEYETGRQLQIIALRHADASSLARALSEAFQAPLRAELERERARLQQGRRREGDQVELPPVLIDADKTVTVTAEVLTNSLIVSANREDLDRIKAVVEQVDKPDFSRLPEPRVIPVRTGLASAAATSIREMYSDLQATRGNGPRSVVVVGDDRAGVLIVRAEEAEFAQIAALAEMLQQEGDRSLASVRTLRLSNVPAARVAQTLTRAYQAAAQQRGEPLTIEIDRGSNSLVIASSEELFNQIKATAEELDGVPALNAPDGADRPATGLGQSVLIIDVQHNSPEQVRQLLEQMGVMRPPADDRPGLVSEPVTVVPLKTRRALAVIASPGDAETIVALVRSLDASPAFAEEHVEVVALKTARAESVATAIKSMLRPAEQDSQTQPAVALAEHVRRLIIHETGVDNPDLTLDLSKPIRILAEPQTNSVIVSSTPENVAVLSQVAKSLDRLPVGDAVVVRFFPLQNASAERIAGVVRGLFSEGERLRQAPGSDIRALPTTETGRALTGQVSVSVDDRTNSLVVAGREEAVALVEVLVGQLDSDRGASWIEPQVIPLQHADAVKLAEKLRQVLVVGARDSAEAVAIQRQIARLRVAQTGDGQGAPVEADIFAPLSTLVIIPEDSMNALLVVGSRANVAAVAALARQLDVPAAAAENTVRFYALEYAAADRVAGIIREIFQQQVRTGAIREQDDVTITSDPRTNSIVVSTSARSFAVVERLVNQLDGERMDPLVGLHVLSVPNADVTQLAPKIERLMRDRIESARRSGEVPSPSDTFSIQPEPASSSLIVAASDENLRMVRDLIDVLTRGASEISDASSIDVFPVRSGRAADLLSTINDLYVEKQNRDRGREAVRVSVDPRLNAIVARGTPEDLAAIGALVERIQSSAVHSVTEIRRIELQKANAEEVVELLRGVLGGRTLSGGRSSGTQAQLLRFIREQQADAIEEVRGREPTEAEISGAIQEQVTLTAELRTNSIVAVAPAPVMALIEAIVADLDQSGAGERIVEIFRLKNADASAMSDVLRELFNLRQEGNTLVLVPGRGGLGAPIDPDLAPGDTSLFPVPDTRQQLAITIDSRTNTLLVSATPEYLDEVRKVVLQLDEIEANDRERLVIDLKNARALEVAQTLGTYFENEARRVRETLGPDRAGSLLRLLEQEVTVQGDEQSNRLLVSVSPRYRDAVENIISELDSTPPQVMIQVLIAEVTIDSSKTWGLDFSVGPFGGEDYIVGFLGAGAGVSTALGVPNLSVSSSDFSLLIRALEAQGRLEVLSRPQILVKNNEPARIQVGENIAIVSDVERLDNGNVRSNVAREDVGIILNVTPSISSDGFVRMDLSPTISSVSARTTQISEDFQAPIINTRELDTVVTVKDGETIVVGGLIQTTDEQRRTKIPFISAIPIIGEAFKSYQYNNVRTELLVILTPQVIPLARTDGVEALRKVTREEILRLSDPEKLQSLTPNGAIESILRDNGADTDGDGVPDSPTPPEKPYHGPYLPER